MQGRCRATQGATSTRLHAGLLARECVHVCVRYACEANVNVQGSLLSMLTCVCVCVLCVCVCVRASARALEARLPSVYVCVRHA